MPVTAGNVIKIKSLLYMPCPLVQNQILSDSIFNCFL